jgi:PP-loop superfamily ATP-utilizing enzyme
MKVRNFANNCDSTCPTCARDFFDWLKSRMKQMDMVQKGMKTSFSEAAATSVRPE